MVGDRGREPLGQEGLVDADHPASLPDVRRRMVRRRMVAVPSSAGAPVMASCLSGGDGGWVDDPRTDRELLAATVIDAESFGVFYRRHVLAMAQFMFRRVLDEDVAADLSAETFAAALDNVHRFDESRGEPIQWLYGIGRNQLRHFWRRRRVSARARRRLGVPREAIDADTLALFERVEAGRSGHAHRRSRGGDGLGCRDRCGMQYRCASWTSCPTTRSRSGWTRPVGTARVRVFRGLAKLREVLGEE